MPQSNQTNWTPNVQQVEPTDPQRMQFVRGLLRDNRLQEAQSELVKMLQQEPRNTQFLMMLGMTSMRLQQYEDAATSFELVMDIDPKNRFAPIAAAHVGMRGDNSEYAETYFHKALEIDPTSVQALTGLATLHERQKLPDAAIEALERAVEIEPNSASVRRRLAGVMARADKTDGAKEQLKSALIANPGDPRLTLQLARLHSEEDDNGKALAVIEDALERNPESQPLLLALGQARMAEEDYPAAADAFRKVLKDEGRRPNPRARIGLAQALIAQKDLTDARAMLSGINQRRYNPAVQRLYGDAFAAENNVEEAENSYRSALLHMPDGHEALAKIDQAKKADGKMTGAKVLKLYDEEFERRHDAIREGENRPDMQNLTADQRNALRQRRDRRRMMMRNMMSARRRDGGQGNAGPFAGRFGNN